MAGKGFLTCGAAAVGLLALLAVTFLTAWGTAWVGTWGRAAPDPARPASRPRMRPLLARRRSLRVILAIRRLSACPGCVQESPVRCGR
jgi:hypothetical protein